MIRRFFLIFIVLFILVLPFEQPLIPFLPGILAPLFEGLAAFTANNLLEWKHTDFRIASDSPGLYISIFLMLIIASSAAFIWTIIDKKINAAWENQTLSGISAFYLSMHLFAYGFSKIFKVQFFLPEPNTLFTPLGNISKDLLFWSSMGSSYTYTVFSGFIEIIPAVLLIFGRTRLLGALIAFGVMLNVFFMNLGFDISVKVFSAFLLFLSVVLILPDAKNLYNFFVLKQTSTQTKHQINSASKNKIIISFSITLFLIINGLYPFLSSGNFNDDRAERPFLHGAYDVNLFVINGDTLTPLLSDNLRWKRVFVHRRGYFIVQNMQDNMYDFKLKTDNNGILFLTDYKKGSPVYRLKVDKKNQKIYLKGNFRENEIYLEATKINLNELPLFKNDFHWHVR